VRQGNTAEHIHIYYYLGKGSFDEFRLDLLKNKSNWMKDLFFGDKSEIDNGDANNDNDYSDLLAADPEEAKRIRLQRIAEQQARDKEKNDKVLVNTLQQLASAATHLKSLDAAKAKELETIEDTLVSAQRLLDRQKTDLASNKAFDNPDKKYMDELESKLRISQATVNRLNERKANLDKKYADKKTELESRIKQKSGYLRGKNKNNELPFDAALIDNPENMVVSRDGQILAVGNVYEITGAAENRNFKLATGHQVGPNGSIFKISEVDATRRLFKIDNIIGRANFPNKGGDDWGWYDINLFPQKGFTQVSYSEKEVELKKLLATEWSLRDMVDGKLDKQTLLENIDKVKLENVRVFVFRNLGTGKVEFHESLAAKDPDSYRFIYPEVGSEDFKKEVCVAYLDFVRSEPDYSTTNKVQSTMAVLFGGGYKNIAEAYGKIATEVEVRELASKMWEELVALNRDATASDMYNLFVTSGIWGTIKEEALKLGDNTQTIQDIVYQFKTMTQDALRQKRTDEANAMKLQEEAKAKEALKANPNYKEISPEVEAAFKKLGLTVKYNTESITLPGFKGRAGIGCEPFERLFIQDSVYKGPLYKCKDILKARHQAKFFKDAGYGFNGAWWHVSSNVDISEIYKLIAQGAF
jgi:effector-binding domain-containing protein